MTKNKALDKDMNRIAKENDIPLKELQEKLDSYTEKGFPINSAWAQVKGEYKSQIRGVKDIYTMWPLDISKPRSAAWDDTDHSLVDVIGLFFGRVEKAKPRTGFILKVSFVDDDIEAAEDLTIMEPSMFKGSFAASKGKVYPVKGVAVSKGTTKDCPTVDEVVVMAKEDSIPLSELLDVTEKGESIHHKTELVFSGVIGDIHRPEGRNVIMEISDIGSDPITVWLPDGVDLDDSFKGAEVLGMGWHKIGDDGPVINAKAFIPIQPDE